MWKPSAQIEKLKQRAKIITQIRQFFADRGVMEVETPLLSNATVTDPYVNGIPVSTSDKTFYLQTSPEYAMKRLLAAGSGDIYQICKAFRQNDIGKIHNPEFTILEWYRLGFDHHALMDDMDDLLKIILKKSSADRFSCKEVYEKFLGVNPHTATENELAECAQAKINFTDKLSDKNAWLDLLFSHCIEPQIGREKPVFLYDFPESQAALAKIRNENPRVASRFEVYFKGVELANGFHELQDANEQRKRFENDLVYRKQNQFSVVPIDENFLSALQHGMPECSGVALGIDRLIMLALEAEKISEVLAFDFSNA
jgi:lysyl-tRNA synthetase class 2